MRRFGGSIEERHGVNEPGYQPPADDAPELYLEEDEWGDRLTGTEVLASFVLPISGIGFAIWRFGRGNIGPGFANLLLSFFCGFIWLFVIGFIIGFSS